VIQRKINEAEQLRLYRLDVVRVLSSNEAIKRHPHFIAWHTRHPAAWASNSSATRNGARSAGFIRY
jgi:hypothetical protein